jgi:hypothetical protein
MAYEPNSGALFRNTRNSKSDLTGQIQVVCPECGAVSSWWMNGWHKTS